MTIRYKLIAAFCLIGFFSTGLLSYIAINNTREALYAEQDNAINALIDEKLSHIYSYIEMKEAGVRTYANLPLISKALQGFNAAFQQGVDSPAYRQQNKIYRSALAHLKDRLKSYDLFLINTDGDIIFTVIHEVDFATNLVSGPYQHTDLASSFIASSTLLDTHITPFHPYDPSRWMINNLQKVPANDNANKQGREAHSAFIATPVMRGGKLLGVLAIQLNSNDYFHLTKNYSGLKSTGVVIIAKREGDEMLVIAPIRHHKDAAFNLRLPMRDEQPTAIQNAVNGLKGSGRIINFEGRDVLAAWRYLPELNWGLVISVDSDEAFFAASLLQKQLIYSAVVIALMAIIMGAFFAGFISRPLQLLVQASKRIAAGDFKRMIPQKYSGELGQLVESFNRMQMSREEFEKELVQSEQLKLDLLNNASAVIYIRDINGKYLFINRMCEKQMNVSNEDIVGKSCYDTFSKEVADKVLSNDREAMAASSPLEFDETMLTAEGLRIYSSVKFPLKQYDGEVYAVCGICNDITEKKQLDTQMKEYRQQLEVRVAERTLELQQSVDDLSMTQKQLIVAEKKALEASRLKSEFLAHMSHEIRTPMNGVVGMADVLLAMDMNDEARECATVIKQSSASLLCIINDILDISKIEAGKLILDKRAFSLQDIVDDIQSFFSVAFKENAIQFRCTMDETLPRAIESDPARLRQILINLIGNAVKFSHDRGEIILRINAAADISDDSDEFAIAFSVEDDGIGIPAAQQANLFEAFTQADNRPQQVQGTGLGLQISKRLVQLLGGQIQLQSEEGRGSIFSFTINVKASDYSSPRATDEPVKQTMALGNISILLVEDNPVNQKVAKAILHQLGCDAILAENGREAVDEVAHKDYDIVLMDCQMPVMNGYDATQLIRQQHKTLPIIAMTASATLEEQQHCRDAGMSDFLAKPIDISSMQHILQRWQTPH